MENIPKNSYLHFNADTMQVIRKLYDLDQPGKMEEAINILEDWLKKQEHFIKKEICREILEKLILSNKGLLERVKLKLDKTCTMRTLIPNFFENHNVKEDFKELHSLQDVVLPKLTSDNYRVYFLKNTGKEFSHTFFFNAYKRLIISYEYLLKHDYTAGYILVFDLSECNLVELIAKLGIMNLYKTLSLLLQGYGVRIKSIHIITTSKSVDVFIKILSKGLSTKLAQRIFAHSNIEPLYDILPKEILPIEYGGKERPLSELHDTWLNLLSSKEHMEHMKIMNATKTDETRRSTDNFNEQYLGTSGTFRSLVID